MGTCDICDRRREIWETHNYHSGLTICKNKEDCKRVRNFGERRKQ